MFILGGNTVEKNILFLWKVAVGNLILQLGKWWNFLSRNRLYKARFKKKKKKEAVEGGDSCHLQEVTVPSSFILKVLWSHSSMHLNSVVELAKGIIV